MATNSSINSNQLLSTTNNVQFATIGVGVAPATADLKVSAGNRIGTWITGTNISSGSDADGLFVDTSFVPSANVGNAASIGLYPTFNPPGGVTITTGYGLYVASGTKGGAGAVTTGYGLFVTAPTIASTNITAQLDNIRLDSNIIASTNSNGTLDVNSAGTGTLSIGTNATSHQVTLGSTSGTSSTTLQSGSGTLSLTATNGAITANSGTGTISVSSDATNTTVNLGTGAGAKLVTLGSTNGASSLALKTGTADFSLASATGTLMTVQDTGAVNFALNPAFFAYPSGNITDVTGDGTTYTIIWNSTLYDIGSNFNTTTGTFAAPIAGKYIFSITCDMLQMSVATSSVILALVTSGGNTYRIITNSFTGGIFPQYTASGSLTISLTAAETVTTTISVGGGTKTADVGGLSGAIYQSHFSGRLVQ